MQNYYSILPSFIASSDIPDGAKILYSIITSLLGRYGFCWATTEHLAERCRKSKAQIKRYLVTLVKRNYIIIETELHYDRKIWTPETWSRREECLRVWKEEARDARAPFNQRFTTWLTDEPGGGSSMHTSPTPPNKDKNKPRIKLGHRGSAAPPRPSGPEEKSQKRNDGAIQLPRMMTKFQPPTRGPEKMVAETKELLDHVLPFGSQKVRMHEDDKKFFFGFSPRKVGEALDRTHSASKRGEKIGNFVAYVFQQCCNISKENN